MGDVYSTGYNNDNATPPVNHPPTEGGGRIRIYKDSYLQGAVDGVIGDVIHMKKLPGGAKVLPGGKLFFGTGNAGETLQVGVTGTNDKLLGATAAAVAGSALLEAAHAAGLDYDVPAGGIEVIVTNATAAIKAAQRVTVWIPYVID